MIVYGRNPVRELLRGRRAARRIHATEAIARESWLARDAGVPVERASADEVASLCGSEEHQGLCAEADPYPYAAAGDLLAPEDALVLCLDQVQDPHNLGAACRVAEAAGASVAIPERRAAHVTPAVCKASAGAVERLALTRVANMADFLAQAKRAEAWVYGADAEARVSYDQPDYSGRVVLVLGSEGKGLRPRVAGACDELVALPRRGAVGSLNVSTAAAALVYGILHFRARGLDRAP